MSDINIGDWVTNNNTHNIGDGRGQLRAHTTGRVTARRLNAHGEYILSATFDDYGRLDIHIANVTLLKGAFRAPWHKSKRALML